MLRPSHRRSSLAPLALATWLAAACSPTQRGTTHPSSPDSRKQTRLDDPFPAQAVLEEIAARPTPASEQLLEHYVEQTHRSFQGLMLHPYELEGWVPELDGDLVTAPHVAAAVTMSHWSPPGSAWGRQLVLVVFTVL